MRLLTILGTRPEIIRLSLILPKLDDACDHLIINTGQNYDPTLNFNFFKELGLRDPNYNLNCSAQHAGYGLQVGNILDGVSNIIEDECPDRFLVLGDTNSSLAAIAAKRAGVPVYHMEAGNRCFDDRVPEEVNRRIIDHVTDVHMPYTQNAKVNLLREGIKNENIYVTGNPIREVMKAFEATTSLEIVNKFHLLPYTYFLVTLHRAENVDDFARLRRIIEGLNMIKREFGYPIMMSTHPHTRAKLTDKLMTNSKIEFHEPFNFRDFAGLETSAACVLTDSGTVQEECCILNTPCVTLRDSTERPETIECGANCLGGSYPETILNSVKRIMNRKSNWPRPEEYMRLNVSDTVVNIVTGHRR